MSDEKTSRIPVPQDDTAAPTAGREPITAPAGDAEPPAVPESTGDPQSVPVAAPTGEAVDSRPAGDTEPAPVPASPGRPSPRLDLPGGPVDSPAEPQGPPPADRPVDPHAPLAADGPTVRLTPPADPEPSRPADPPEVAADEEPMVPSLRERLDDGETVRLQPPFFAPGTSRLPRHPAPPPAPDEPPAGPRRSGLAQGASPDEPEWEPLSASAARTVRLGPPESPRPPASEEPGGGAARRDDPGVPDDAVSAESPEPVTVPTGEPPRWRRITSAGALIWVLLALLGFTLVVQLRSNDADAGLATARQEDLVGILSDLEARDQRLQQEINTLEESQRQLTSGVAGRQAALAEADKRADELGLLAGTLPARGPGLRIVIDPRGASIKASQILNAVQELRGAGGEVMEIAGADGIGVRIVASSYFVDADGGDVIVDGKQLSGPYTLRVIGVPSTMQTALQIPGGVVASVSQAGGNVTMEQRSTVEVTAVRQPTSLQYARPVK
ncbi:DUF881 domain-containing protein [Actinoplanes sp. NPDC049668]|uniref:DUF881 domain-containing protein n=1 Tax=unclassified Actinoplanes TaxID=2626549 RepID=UPI0033A8B197